MAGVREGLHKCSSFPRRLKPRCNGCAYGGTEVPPFQNGDLFRDFLTRVLSLARTKRRGQLNPRRHFPSLPSSCYILGMLGKYTTSQMRSPWRILLGVLCIALVMLSGVAAATHSHSHGEVSHQDCGLCVTAHMAIQIAVTVTQVCVVQVFTRVEASSPIASLQLAPQFALFSRPPPADANLF